MVCSIGMFLEVSAGGWALEDGVEGWQSDAAAKSDLSPAGLSDMRRLLLYFATVALMIM